MDRLTAKQITEAMMAQLRPLEKTFGVQIRAKGGRFGATTLEARFEIAELGIDGVAATPERAGFADAARFFGLKPEDLDATFKCNGDVFKIVGLSTRRGKYPVSVTRQPDGKQFKFGAETVVRALGRKV